MVLIIGASTVPWPPFGPAETPAKDAACERAFGDGAEYASSFHAGNPPLMACKHNGETKWMDMPYHIAQQEGLNATAYEDEWWYE